MSGKKWTPGPWECHRPFSTAARFPYYIRATLPCGNEVLVAAVYSQAGRDDLVWDEQETANARLISASPDMAEAGKAAIEGREGWQELMRAALAKAGCA